jgi:anti-repressor protein
MSSDLTLFANAGDGLRPEHFGLTEDGRAYVIASVFAKAMGYRDASNATRLLDEAEVGTQIVSTSESSGRVANRPVSVIYEDGIWELIFRSTLPSAKSIKARVKAILRELRETGVIDTRPDTRRPMTELEMARKYVAALEKLDEAAPKVEAHDAFMSADGCYLVGAVAKLLGLGQNQLFARLRAEDILITGGRRHNIPYQQYMRHFKVIASSYEDSDGVSHATYTTYVKPGGVDFIRKVLKMPAPSGEVA